MMLLVCRTECSRKVRKIDIEIEWVEALKMKMKTMNKYQQQRAELEQHSIRQASNSSSSKKCVYQKGRRWEKRQRWWWWKVGKGDIQKRNIGSSIKCIQCHSDVDNEEMKPTIPPTTPSASFKMILTRHFDVLSFLRYRFTFSASCSYFWLCLEDERYLSVHWEDVENLDYPWMRFIILKTRFHAR